MHTCILVSALCSVGLERRLFLTNYNVCATTCHLQRDSILVGWVSMIFHLCLSIAMLLCSLQSCLQGDQELATAGGLPAR